MEYVAWSYGKLTNDTGSISLPSELYRKFGDIHMAEAQRRPGEGEAMTRTKSGFLKVAPK